MIHSQRLVRVAFPLALGCGIVPFALQGGSSPAADQPWTQAELESMSQEIRANIEELRNAKYTRPVAVRLADKAKFFEYAKQREELSETPEKVSGDEQLAKLLGVIPPEMDLMATTMEFLKDQVGGFYDPKSSSFSLMDKTPKGVAKIVLAHELDHALDDQLFDMDREIERLKSNADETLAYQSVCEGSGTVVMAQWAARFAKGAGVSLSDMQAMQDQGGESMAKAPMWLWKPLVAVYLRGASFLARSESLLAGQAGNASADDIARAFRKVPRSTEQILHPEKYWDPAKQDEPIRVRFDTSNLPSGWKVLREDTLGEMMLAIVTTPPAERTGLDMKDPLSILGVKFTNRAASGWGGDRVVLLGNERARFLQLVSRWDSERDAGEFLEALELLRPSFESAASGFAKFLSSAAKGSDGPCGSGLDYGADAREVVLTIWSGVAKSARTSLEHSLKHSTGE